MQTILNAFELYFKQMRDSDFWGSKSIKIKDKKYYLLRGSFGTMGYGVKQVSKNNRVQFQSHSYFAENEDIAIKQALMKFEQSLFDAHRVFKLLSRANIPYNDILKDLKVKKIATFNLHENALLFHKTDGLIVASSNLVGTLFKVKTRIRVNEKTLREAVAITKQALKDVFVF